MIVLKAHCQEILRNAYQECAKRINDRQRDPEKFRSVTGQIYIFLPFRVLDCVFRVVDLYIYHSLAFVTKTVSISYSGCAPCSKV